MEKIINETPINLTNLQYFYSKLKDVIYTKTQVDTLINGLQTQITALETRVAALEGNNP